MTPAGSGTSKHDPADDPETTPEDVPEVTSFFRVQMESPDGEHTRDATVQAESEERARYIVEGQERGLVDFRLDTDELATVKSQLSVLSDAGLKAKGTLPHSRLTTHEQTEPYTITSVEEI